MKKRFFLSSCMIVMLLASCFTFTACGKETITCKIVCKLDDDFSLGLSTQEIPVFQKPQMQSKGFKGIDSIKELFGKKSSSPKTTTVNKLVITDSVKKDTLQFELHETKDNYYYIEHSDSGLVLGTQENATALNTPVTFVKYTKDDTQLWYFVETNDDYYYIVNKATDLFLDISGASIHDGNSLKLYTRNDVFNAQSWKFIDMEDDDNEFYPKTLELPDLAQGMDLADVVDSSETYHIVSKLDSDFGIGASMEDVAKVVLSNSTDQDVIGYRIEKADDTSYYIIHNDSELVMEVQNGATEDNSMVCLNTNQGLDYQKWEIEPTSDGYYYFINVASGLYLDITNVNLSDGNWLQIYHQNDAFNAQSWAFVSFDED